MAPKIPKGFVSDDELLKRRPITPQERERIDEIKRGLALDIGLNELRERSGVSQTVIAERMATSQPNVSRIEKEDDIRLSTLQRYVGALGGELRIEAVLPDGEHVQLIGGKAA